MVHAVHSTPECYFARTVKHVLEVQRMPSELWRDEKVVGLPQPVPQFRAQNLQSHLAIPLHGENTMPILEIKICIYQLFRSASGALYQG